MALRVSMATWITPSIRIMDTRARCPDVVRRHLIISRGMRPVTAAATWSQNQVTVGPKNTRCLGTVAVVNAAAREDVHRSEELISLKSFLRDRPVIDKTGLLGRYDFTLEFARSN